MEWHDEALVLSVRKHGETAAVASLLTLGHGRRLGLVRGGQSRRRQGLLQPGNLVAAGWRARLPEHLGTFTLEPRRDFAALALEDPGRLAALAAMAAVLDEALPEHDPQPRAFADGLALLEALAAPPGGGDPIGWLAAYVCWELALLRILGFGLDLGSCAATGATADLVYVSPRSGRAVSAAAGAPYHDRLLPLPAFLHADDAAPAGADDIVAGLRLTGYFLERHHYAAHGGKPPAARARLAAWAGRAVRK